MKKNNFINPPSPPRIIGDGLVKIHDPGTLTMEEWLEEVDKYYNATRRAYNKLKIMEARKNAEHTE